MSHLCNNTIDVNIDRSRTDGRNIEIDHHRILNPNNNVEPLALEGVGSGRSSHQLWAPILVHSRLRVCLFMNAGTIMATEIVFEKILQMASTFIPSFGWPVQQDVGFISCVVSSTGMGR